MLKPVKLPIRDLVIHQNSESQAVSTASALLVEYCLRHYEDSPQEVLELGCGCGIVSIMLALSRPSWKLTGIDLLPTEIALAQSNALSCELKIAFLEADLRTYTAPTPISLIVANPPWMPLGSGKSSHHINRRIAREELYCTMADVLACLERNLAPAGEAVLIYPKQRENDLRDLLLKSSLDIIELSYRNDPQRFLIARLKHSSGTHQECKAIDKGL